MNKVSNENLKKIQNFMEKHTDLTLDGLYELMIMSAIYELVTRVETAIESFSENKKPVPKNLISFMQCFKSELETVMNEIDQQSCGMGMLIGGCKKSTPPSQSEE